LDSLRTHRRTLMSEPEEIPGEILSQVYLFARRLGADSRWTPRGSNARPLVSASYEHPRRVGGMSVALKEHYPLADLFSTMVTSEENTPKGSALMRGCSALSANAVWRKVGLCPPDDFEPPRVRASALPERGGKVRTVTVGYPEDLVRAHVIREFVWPSLRAIPAVVVEGEDAEDARVTRIISRRWSRLHQLVSTDLSAATDFAPFRLGRTVWRGLLDGLISRNLLQEDEAEGCLREVSRLLGPNQVLWPGNAGGPGLSRRGWLMGCPLTWWTLSVSHAAIIDAVGLMDRAVVKGDDALLLATPGETEEYLSAMRAAGFKVNESKSFISKNGGVFCERFFLRTSPGAPIRPVPVKRMYPLTAERLAKLSKELDKLPKKLRAVYRAECWRSASLSGLLEEARRFGIPLSLPRELGGLGIPHRRGLKGALASCPRWATLFLVGGIRPPSFEAESTLRAYDDTRLRLTHLTKRGHRMGLLGTSVPISSGEFNRLVSQRALGYTMVRPHWVREFDLRLVGQRWARYRKRFRDAKVPHSINPLLWNWPRIAGNLAAAAIQGIYTVGATNVSLQSGITTDELRRSWTVDG